MRITEKMSVDFCEFFVYNEEVRLGSGPENNPVHGHGIITAIDLRVEVQFRLIKFFEWIA